MTTQLLDKSASAGTSLSWAAPLRIGAVSLVVRDLSRVSGYYQEVLGLKLIDGDARTARLGTASAVLLELRQHTDARQRSPREAGLFHTAFLLPSRADLAQWITHAARNRYPVQGASDHIVSEAIYLADPEGNGIEIYSDRPQSQWRRDGKRIEMSTEALDVEDILRSSDGGAWSGIPEGSFVGHIHLQIGEIASAERFYGEVLGFDITERVPGGSFYAAGGYHHHIATNIWNSRGAPLRGEGGTGLAGFEIVATSDAANDALRDRISRAGLASVSGRIADPWGNAITITRN